MQEPEKKSQELPDRTPLFRAILAAQADLTAISRDSEGAVGAGGARKYKYASLAAILEVVRPALAGHGLFVTQHPFTSDRMVSVLTAVTHADSGESIECSVGCPADHPTPQQLGSLITYLRRYSLSALLCLVPADEDDGAEAEKGAKYAAERKREAADRYAVEKAKLLEAISQAEKAGLIAKPKGAEGFKALLEDLLQVDVEMDKISWSDLSEATKALARRMVAK